MYIPKVVDCFLLRESRSFVQLRNLLLDASAFAFQRQLFDERTTTTSGAFP
jgi:hypothetical protein